ncbi:hypothetical protein LT493_17540 [Streptomyces tricolor]|nr:hypothetical protein [Streptomyces tricolor]
MLFTTADTKERTHGNRPGRHTDGGRPVADQERPGPSRAPGCVRVAVRSPHAARLAALLTKDARVARRPSKSCARAATAVGVRHDEPPTSARSRSATASSSINWPTK